MTFTSSNLLIGDAEIAALTSALSSAGQADPISAAIEEKLAKVETMAGAYELPEAWLRSLVRALTLFELYSRVGQAVPAHVKSSYDEAMKDLTEIRDGKYSDLLKAGETPASSANSPASGHRHHHYSRRKQDGL